MRALERRLRAMEGVRRALTAMCATVLTRPGMHATQADLDAFNTQLSTARERGGPLVILTLNRADSLTKGGTCDGSP